MADVDEPDPAAVADAAASFCTDFDDGEQVLETVLAIDAEHGHGHDRDSDSETDADVGTDTPHGTWTFDDLPLDSGTFGELVSRDIVTKVDGEYRVSSREGVRAAIEGSDVGGTDEPSSAIDRLGRPSLESVDVRAAGALAGALVFLFAMRLLNYGSVVRGDHVVSPGNDPYHYRYWMGELLAESDGVTDWSVITAMPDRAAGTRPLTHASNWFLAELLGGDQWAADAVAAWLPVVATVALGIVVYWLAVVLTDDVRVGIASVVLLALTPVHAVYSGVGFLEHRPYQYFWIGVTVLGLAWLAVDLQRRRERAATARAAATEHLRQPWTWLAAVTLGVALALSAHAWGGSILLFVPVAGYVGLKAALDVREGVSPALANVPLVAGLVVSSLVSAFLHLRWGWHESFIAVVPAVVVVGALGVVVLGESWHRLELAVPVTGLIGIQAALAGAGVAAFRALRPEDWARLRERADDLFFRDSTATETGSIFATENAVILEPMAQLGVNFYLAIIVLGWAVWIAARRYEPGWLLLSVYALFWVVMATLQVRFAAQLAIPLSVLGGLGLVSLLAWVDLVRLPKPFRADETGDRDGKSQRTRGTAADGGEREPSIIVSRDVRKLATLAWIALLICGMSLIFVPSLSAQTVHSDAQFEATMAVDDHAADVDREYPENFVLSAWGDNRMHNYFVSGESDGYGYAASNFADFQSDSDPDDWYDQFADDDVGYVVMTDFEGDAAETTTQAQLHDDYGAGGNETDALAHYQAIHVDDEATAFAVVPGATIAGSGESGETVTAETEATVSGETIAYERDATVDDDGSFSVTVPYPGEYAVDGQPVEVSADEIEDGEQVELE